MMMPAADLLDMLRCPRCLGRVFVPDCPWVPFPDDVSLEEMKLQPLLPEEGEAEVCCGECEATYAVHDGLFRMVGEDMSGESDKKWRGEYDQMAEQYDASLKMQMKWLGVDYEAEQQRLVQSLELEPGMKVLEVSVGTGRNLLDVAPALRGEGCIVGLDISTGMLGVARRRLGHLEVPVGLAEANAASLPFASGQFDAVLHVGGLNTFSFKGRALAEMVRVAAPGARVVVCDEGVPESMRNDSWYGTIMEANTLYRERPPVDLVPHSEICEFRVVWVVRNLYYVLQMRKR